MGYDDAAFPIGVRGPSRRSRRRHIPVERRLVVSQLIQTLAARGKSKPVLWRTKSESAKLPFVVLRTCTVAVKDLQDVEHSVDVTAETLYEAVAAALAALQKDNWAGELGQGFTTITVLVQQPPIRHELKMKDFVSWLGRQGRSPAEVTLKQKLERILSRNDARPSARG